VGDLLLEKSGGGEIQPVGALVLYDHDTPAVCSNFIARVTVADRYDPRFLTYLHAALYALRINTRHIKQSTGIQNLDSASYLCEATGLPPEPEQAAIATYLDRETARIDTLVANKERLIELLQEKRTALITRVVTKGLNPTVHMKDSGVEWLEKVPAHWELFTLKRRAKRIQTGTTPATSETKYYEDGTIAWYGPGSFVDDLPLQAPIKFISESAVRDGVARVFESGTAMVVTIGATIGKVAYLEQTGSCNQQITGVTFDTRHVITKYGAYQLKRSEPILRGIAPNTTLPILDQEEVGYLPFVVPPQPEQCGIVAFLDRETARIDGLVAKVHFAIDRLKELRSTFISAAVTGKIDVREEAA
jgi:type I restriction enzyme S subunit